MVDVVPRLTSEEARRVALAAQGLGARRPAKPGAAHVLRVAHQVQAFQIDTVNVLVRAHYLPAYSRLGPYPVDALDRLTNVRHDLVEVRDGHQASYIPVSTEPLLRWRRDGVGGRNGRRSRWRAAIDPAYAAAVEQQVVDHGPLGLSDLEDPRRRAKLPPDELTIRRRDGQPYAESSLRWGRPSDGKTVLDGLLHEGRLALAGRRGHDRLYDLSERVLPETVRRQPAPPPEEARIELVRLSARSLGVATLADLASVFVLKIGDVRTAVKSLVSEGALQEVAVDGWRGAAYLDPSLDLPRKPMDARALLGPFDSLTWSRERTARLFDFEFSFEIYVPEAKRRFGYYVLPFLFGDRLVARVDLKADRSRSTLVLAGAYAEAGTRAKAITGPLQDELRRLADWLGLDDVDASAGRGDLAPLLARR